MVVDRRQRVVGLHPLDEPGRHRPLRTRKRWRQGHRPLTIQQIAGIKKAGLEGPAFLLSRTGATSPGRNWRMEAIIVTSEAPRGKPRGIISAA